MPAVKIAGPIFFLYSFDFLNVYLPNQKGRSDNTVESYTDTLTILKNYISSELKRDIGDFRFSECTVEFVWNFISWLKANGNCAKTRNQRLSGIKGYLDYASERDISLTSICTSIMRIDPERKEEKEKAILSDKQVLGLMATAPQTTIGVRNRVIILTLYETAIRVSELVDLKISQLYITRENPYILIHGKGKKERNVPITAEFAKVLSTYIEKHHDGSTDYLFYTTHKGKRVNLSTRTIQDIIHRYANDSRAEDSTLPNSVSPHTFRRTRATALYNKGMPIELVSSLLGHTQVETTRIYAKPTIERMRKEIENSIPEEAYNQEPLWKGKEQELSKKFGLR